MYEVSFCNVQMYVTPPDTDVYAIPKVLAPMPQKVCNGFQDLLCIRRQCTIGCMLIPPLVQYGNDRFEDLQLLM